MGNVPQDWDDPEKVPPQVGLPDGKDTAKARYDRQLGLPTARWWDQAGIDLEQEEMDTEMEKREYR